MIRQSGLLGTNAEDVDAQKARARPVEEEAEARSDLGVVCADGSSRTSSFGSFNNMNINAIRSMKPTSRYNAITFDNNVSKRM